MTSPMFNGRFSATSKPVMAWGRPSSWIAKSSFASPLTKCESLSIADTWSCTMSTRTLSTAVEGPRSMRMSLASLPSSAMAVARSIVPRV